MIHSLIFSLGLILPTGGVDTNAIQSNKPRSGPDSVAKTASALMPKEQKQFNMFYYPPKSKLSDCTSRLLAILQKSDMKGKLLIIGSEDTSLLPRIIQEVFPKFYPDRLQGAYFILVGSKEHRDELIKVVQGTGATCFFGELPDPITK